MTRTPFILCLTREPITECIVERADGSTKGAVITASLYFASGWDGPPGVLPERKR